MLLARILDELVSVLRGVHYASSLLILAMGFPLTTPSPGINYNFVSGAYLVCSVILVVLLALDKVGHLLV